MPRDNWKGETRREANPVYVIAKQSYGRERYLTVVRQGVMEPIKPGTRCECREVYCTGQDHVDQDTKCDANAIKLIPVVEGKSLDGTPMMGKRALCAACADWHEKAAK